MVAAITCLARNMAYIMVNNIVDNIVGTIVDNMHLFFACRITFWVTCNSFVPSIQQSAKVCFYGSGAVLGFWVLGYLSHITRFLI